VKAVERAGGRTGEMGVAGEKGDGRCVSVFRKGGVSVKRSQWNQSTRINISSMFLIDFVILLSALPSETYRFTEPADGIHGVIVLFGK
jgi:hypothetical protein